MPNFSPGEETLFMVMGLTADQRVALWSTAAERGVTCAEMLVSHLVAIGIIPGTPAALPPFTPEQGQWKKGPRT
jgi:Na+/melibiose symporter-like transporter